jgi:hypothetical protein
MKSILVAYLTESDGQRYFLHDTHHITLSVTSYSNLQKKLIHYSSLTD